MASLTHAIRIFQSGALSAEELFAQVDRAVAEDHGNSAQLLEILSEEHTKLPLPPEVFAEVQRRIEHRADSPPAGNAEETHVVGNAAPPTLRTAPAEGESPAGTDAERPKGVGDTLNGRFVLEECLGLGGMGTVYRALDLRKQEASDRNPYVAIKVLNAQFQAHPKSLIALQREARKAQKLAHPNIVTVYDFDRDGATVYLTMEYLSGRPLNRLLREAGFSGMPLAEAFAIVEGMGKALAYAHQRGFVHCDFKPGNVFLTKSGEVKVIDFGISRLFQPPDEDADATVFDPGCLGGLTPAYASPEMLEHRDPDPRDDIYALGCITYELLTGRHPFDRVVATQARSNGLKPQRPAGLSGRQWKALSSALAFERDRRTPTVEQFIEGMRSKDRTAAYVIGGGTIAVVALVAAVVGLYNLEFGATGGGADETPAATVPAAVEPARVDTAEARRDEPERVEDEPAEDKTAATEPAPASASAPAVPALSLAVVEPLLAQVPCSALWAAADGGTLRVQGYLGEGYGEARLRETLGSVAGVTGVRAEVLPISDDKCRVVESLAPYWTRNRAVGAATSIRTSSGRTNLTEGDRLTLDITTPGYESYVNIDYYALDGQVIHLIPSPRANANLAPPNHTATVGALGNWVVSPPFGTELIVLLVTPAPLFDTLRPEVESRTEYLRALEGKLAQLERKYGPEQVTVDFVQISTKAKKP